MTKIVVEKWDMWPAQSQGEAGRTAREINCRIRGQGRCFSRHSKRILCAYWLCILLHNLHPIPLHSDFSSACIKASPCQTPPSLSDSLTKYVSVNSLHLTISDTKLHGSMRVHMRLLDLSNTRRPIQTRTTQVLATRASFLDSCPQRFLIIVARPLPLYIFYRT